MDAPNHPDSLHDAHEQAIRRIQELRERGGGGAPAPRSRSSWMRRMACSCASWSESGWLGASIGRPSSEVERQLTGVVGRSGRRVGSPAHGYAAPAMQEHPTHARLGSRALAGDGPLWGTASEDLNAT